MTDPTGAIRYSELLSHAGAHLGHGYGQEAGVGHPAWGPQEARRIRDATKGGVLQVYKPPVIPGDNESHGWTFLRPVQEVVVASGAGYAPLPADFGGVEGDAVVRLSGTGRQAQEVVRRVGIGDLEYMRRTNATQTGPPLVFAEEWQKGASDAAGQRCRLAVFPTANQEYTLRLEWYFNRDVEQGMGEFIYGGADHWNLFVTSVKAWAERHYDDGGNGSMRAAFMEELAGAVSRDRRRKAGTLGYNGDRWGRVWDGRDRPPHKWDRTTVTYQGQTW